VIHINCNATLCTATTENVTSIPRSDAFEKLDIHMILVGMVRNVSKVEVKSFLLG